MEIIVIIGVKPQGKAINTGVARAKGEYLVILDDDSRIRDRDTIAKIIAALRGDPKIGMAGASIIQPVDATRFQRFVAREFPRFNMPVMDTLTDSDMACHGCCGFRREVFEEIGREPEDIVRGLDPILRAQLRSRGYRVVLVPHASVSHPVPGSIRELCKMFYRNGRGSAYAQRSRPDMVFDTHEKAEWQGENLHTPLWQRAFRFPLRSLCRLFSGHPVRALGDIVYLIGYARESFAGTQASRDGTARKAP